MKSTMFFVLIIATVISCRSGDKKPDASGQNVVYADYKIWGEEDRETVTIRVQFRQGGKNGASIILASPAEVKLDGETLTSENTGEIGAFYETHKSLADFTGEHTITFLDESGKEHKQVFSYEPFVVNPLSEIISREDLVLEVESLKKEDFIHLIMTDTSFNSNDINSIDTVENGKLLVTKERLNALENGPINLQLIYNNNKVIREEGKRTGQLTVTYSLQREFVLSD